MDVTGLLGEAQNLLAPILGSALIAGLAWAKPELHKRIPNFFWPLAVFILARLGGAICDALHVSCSGNPLNWGPEVVNALAAAFVVVAGHQIARAGKNGLTSLLAKLTEKAGGT